MALQRLNPAGLAPPVGAYVHGVRGGGLVFVAGQVARDREGRIVGVGDIEAQTAQALENVQAVLAEAGCTLADVVKLTVYLTDMRHRERVSAVRRRYFGEHLPASTMVEVSKLGSPELLIEIDAIALAPAQAPTVAEDEL
ncbi:MAG TPA: RidA family protein [Chloroflexota bacterium]|nr:RidA family protein [Chloroflexota bacterium]